MKMKLKRIFCVALAAPLCGVLTAWAATDNAPANLAPAPATNSSSPDQIAQLFGDAVIARGQGVEITRSQLDAEIQRLKTTMAARGTTLTPDDIANLKPRVLNNLINQQLLLDQATAADRAEGRAEFEKLEKELKTAGKLTDEQFNQKLNAQLLLLGLTKAQWEKQSTDQTTALAVLKRGLHIAATDAEIQAFYRTNTDKFQVPEQVHVRHLLLMTIDPVTRQPLPQDQQQAKRKQIEDLLQRARAGEDFAKLAQKYSEDEATRDDGGDLPPFDSNGLFAGGRMDPIFTAAAFSLTNHQISDIVTTQFGYHIIQSLGKTPAHTLALTDKLPSSDMTVAEEIKNYLEQQQLAKLAPAYFKKLNQDAHVEILDPSLKLALAGEEEQSNPPPAAPEK